MPPKGLTHAEAQERFWQYVLKMEDGCWLWIGARDKDGYGQVRWRIFRPKGRLGRAHRLAWEFSHGPIPQGRWVLHRCDNPPCVNPHHLYLGDVNDNSRDCRDRGRMFMNPNPLRGERHPKTKLREEDVRRIRMMSSHNVPHVKIAKMYEVTDTCICYIVQRRTWKHIP